MPKEQLLGLAADVDRLLAAGVGMADGDSLRRREKTLRELGKKVPALVPVADAVARVTGATTPGPAFLDLLVMMRQVRASLAPTGVDGPLTALPESGPWQTSVPVRELLPVGEALSQSGSGREERVKDAAERKLFGDLRLVAPLLGALGDVYAPVADLVAEKGLPAVGRGVLAELESGLNLAGKAADARRLRSICRIDAATGARLCRQVLAEGSAPLRIEALTRLAEVAGADEAEKTGLEYCRDRNREVRSAALTALRVGVSDETLETLFSAVEDKEDAVRNAAVESLGSVGNPHATERLLALLQTALSGGESSEGGKKAKKLKGSKASAQAATVSVIPGDMRMRVVCAMKALGHRKNGDLRAVAETILPLIRSRDPMFCAAAVSALRSLGPVTEKIVPTLIDALGDKKGDMADHAVEVLAGFPGPAREAAVPALVTFVESRKGSRVEALSILVDHLNRHKEDVLRAARAALTDPGLQGVVERHRVFETLGKMGPAGRSLLPAIFDTFRNAKEEDRYWLYENRSVVTMLDPEGEESIPSLIRLLGEKKSQSKALALQALAAYGFKARAAVGAIEPLTASKDQYVKTLADRALAAIQ